MVLASKPVVSLSRLAARPVGAQRTSSSPFAFEIDRATQSVWCGDAADLLRPLYELMVQRVLQSHVIGTDDTVMPMLAPAKTKQARMWVYVGDADNPYNIFQFTVSRSRDGPARFLKDYRQTLLADAYGGYDGVVVGNCITRAGCWRTPAGSLWTPKRRSPPSLPRRWGSSGNSMWWRNRRKTKAMRIACACGTHSHNRFCSACEKDSGHEGSVAPKASDGRGGELHTEP